MGFNAETSKKKEKAIKLRLAGNSYGQIMKKLSISSKGTLSYWFKHMHLPPSSVKKLEKNIQLARERGLLKFNKERSRRIAVENKKELRLGKKAIGKVSKRDLILISAALYWGEGTKSLGGGRSPGLDFANSDPKMITLFMRFIRKVLMVEESRIRAGINMYPGLSESRARLFWAEVTGLSEDRFFITRNVSRASKGKRSWNRLPHGTAVIRVNNRQIFYRVMGMIDGLSNE